MGPNLIGLAGEPSDSWRPLPQLSCSHARNDEGSGDYQGIAKMLIDQHRQFYVGDSEEEGSSDEGAKRATTKRGTGSGAAGATALAGWAASGKKQVTCGRCGKEGHLKRDCKETCKRCGLQCCGGVRDPKRCMTCEGIKPAFRKIMERDAGSK